MDQARQHNHRYADYPNHLEETEEAVIKTEEDSDTHHRKLEHNQPEPTRQQEFREFALTLAPGQLHISPRAREENKHRRAKMRNPASKEKLYGGFRKVGRIESERS